MFKSQVICLLGTICDKPDKTLNKIWAMKRPIRPLGNKHPPPHELTRRNNNQQKSNNLFSLAMMSMMKCSRFLRKWSLNNWTLTLLHKLLYYTNVFYCFVRGRLSATTPRCRAKTTNPPLKTLAGNKLKNNLILRVASYTFRWVLCSASLIWTNWTVNLIVGLK